MRCPACSRAVISANDSPADSCSCVVDPRTERFAAFSSDEIASFQQSFIVATPTHAAYPLFREINAALLERDPADRVAQNYAPDGPQRDMWAHKRKKAA